MASRLFRAVVGTGIAIGASASACVGAVTVVPLPDDLADDVGPAPSATTTTEAAAPEAAADATSNTDVVAAPDVATDTAPVDDAGPPDVAYDAAFCDAAWPTTKGSPPPSCIDPNLDCANEGPPYACSPELDGGGRCRMGTPSATVCVGAQWVCPPGFIRDEQCSCFEDPDSGICTDAGPMPMDAAHD